MCGSVLTNLYDSTRFFGSSLMPRNFREKVHAGAAATSAALGALAYGIPGAAVFGGAGLAGYAMERISTAPKGKERDESSIDSPVYQLISKVGSAGVASTKWAGKSILKFCAGAWANALVAKPISEAALTQLHSILSLPILTKEDYQTVVNPNSNGSYPLIDFETLTLFVAPVAEEILFRGVIQDLLFDRGLRRAVQKIAPGKETAMDTNIAKYARIVLSAGLFSLIHLSNRGIFSDNYVKIQVAYTFLWGITLGIIKESRLGLPGAIGAHFNNNMIAYMAASAAVASGQSAK